MSRRIVVIILVGLTLAHAAPAQAAWRPNLVPVGERLGYAHYELRDLCEGYPPPQSRTARQARQAFCDPTAPRPTALTRDAARMGWCFRWARAGGTRGRISATCARDIDRWDWVGRRYAQHGAGQE